jgi:alpha-D-ribose 1-methylphosphonate 5-triphosphate synthase subunit PhnH
MSDRSVAADEPTVDPALVPGFTDPVHDAQRCFRRVLDAVAHPGQIYDIGGGLRSPPPAPLDIAAASVLLTLCDVETALFLSPRVQPTAAYLRFHCGAPLALDPAEAAFAVFADAGDLPLLDAFALGTDEYPDRSTTLVLQVRSLDVGSGATLRGPGIADARRLSIGSVGASFWPQRIALQKLFPRGLDTIFTCGSRLAALPRSTLVEG